MLTWLTRVALLATGVLVMWWEGSHQPAPGVGFAVAMACILAAPFVRIGRH